MVRIRPSIFPLLFFLLFPSIPSAKYLPLLWEKPIRNALNDRDYYYHKIGIDHDRTIIKMLWTPKGSLSLKEQLELNEDISSPWYHFLLGITNLRLSVENAAFNFHDALEYTQNRPGVTWVLFLEFRQAKQENWAEKCLKNLEKYFFSAGAQSVPVISQQLLAIAKSEKANGNNKAAEKYFDWSSRFERYPFWQTFTRGWGFLPRQPGMFFNACIKCLDMIRSSWLLQLTLLYYLYKWLRFVIVFFICIIFIVVSLETLPIALHPIMSLFLLSVSTRLRYIFCVAIFVSLAVFGLIPFLLLTALLLWSHSQKNKKMLLAFIFSLLILSPIDARIQEMFRVSLSPNKPLGLFRRAVSEGWHSDLENRVKENLRKNNADYLSHLSAAILDLKKNSTESSIFHIKNAEKLNANDPVTLITAGNIFYSTGNNIKAQAYYKKCLESFPNNETALFNLGQLSLSLMDTSEGMEQIKNASELNPRVLNNFIEKNASYFLGALPRLRQSMQPAYKTNYFWKHVFPNHCGSWESTKKIWGSTSLGIPPLFFLCIAPILFILLLTINITNPPEEYLFCKLCGNPMCKKCRDGLICQDCIQATNTIRNEALCKQAKISIMNRKRLIINLTTTILNFLFPGAGGLYKKESIGPFNIILTIVTSFIYASYAALFSFSFSYPFWVAKSCFTVVFICLFMYSLYFAISSVKVLLFELHTSEDNNVT